MFSGWCITADYIEAGRLGYGQNEEDVYRSNAGFGMQFFLRTEIVRNEIDDPIAFRIYDDDGNHYFSGVISKSWLEGDDMFAFSPLSFAEKDTGATELKYWDKDTKEWTLL